MEEQQTVDQLLNHIIILKEALEFYADENNYNNELILKDKGHQARFVLENTKSIDKMYSIFEKDIEDLKDLLKEKNDNDFLEKINKLENEYYKNLKDKINKNGIF